MDEWWDRKEELVFEWVSWASETTAKQMDRNTNKHNDLGAGRVWTQSIGIAKKSGKWN